MYQKTLDRIHSFERFGSKLDLDRIEKLMELLDNPQEKLKCIHVAGTNGKGSVCEYIYKGLQANDYKVGMYTSPFLEEFNERIAFNGEYISDDDLVRCCGKVFDKADKMIALGYDSPTEFEIVTAVAFQYFADKEADFVVLETGLGGKGDSTNIIKKPLITIISSISYDHMDRLGDTLEEIAADKAGIIKSGVAVVSNVKPMEAKKVIARTAYAKKCVLHDVTKIKYGNIRYDTDGTTFDTYIYGTEYNDVELSMVGNHQIENAMAALVAMELLRKEGTIKVERSRLYKGLSEAKKPGRFEVIRKEPVVILDGAHNEEGAEALADAIALHFAGSKILLVCGILKDKKIDKILDILCGVGTDFVATEPDSSRKATAEEIAAKIKTRGKQCIAVADRREAVEYAESHKDEYDVIIYAGSLYLIGDIRRMYRDVQ